MVMLTTTEEKPKSGKNLPVREEKAKVYGSNGASVNSCTPHEKLVLEIKDYLEKGFPASKLKPFLDPSGTSQQVFDALFEAMFVGAGKSFSTEVTKKKNYLAAVTQNEGSQLFNALEAFCNAESETEDK
ncbi:hypothetical protein POM88_024284 [Heracleum sosnowskyi]|uniref:Uncharacterized protein n=1 Tax=Heracleum sosnowskyi TaxID=360622 RepID=A0AAD8I2N1_9APIA|nr:hypothetical protein POM88_024284 [Heracleum sosnowskyi]